MSEVSLEVDPHFGDLILYWGRSFEAWVLKQATGSWISHCAIRTGENTAKSIDALKGLMDHDLNNPREIYYAYAILEHIGATPEKRERMMRVYNALGKQYDFSRVLKLGLKHAKVGVSNWFDEKSLSEFVQDNRNISTDPDSLANLIINQIGLKTYRRIRGFWEETEIKNGRKTDLNECASLFEMICYYSRLGQSIPGVHFSQIEPPQFLLESKKYDITEIWVRPGFKISVKNELEAILKSPLLNLSNEYSTFPHENLIVS